MKNILLLFLLITLILLAGCEKDPEYEPEDGFTDKIEVTLYDVVSKDYTELTVAASVNYYNRYPISRYGFRRQIFNSNIEWHETDVSAEQGPLRNNNFTYTIKYLQPATDYVIQAFVQYGETKVYSRRQIKVNTKYP